MPAPKRGSAGEAFEIVNETVDQEVDIGAVYNHLIAMLVRAYRRRVAGL
jgi:hypothetical protein